MEKRFVGKVALVTGATNGIGQATAVRLAAEGALVGVNQRPTGDPTETYGMMGRVWTLPARLTGYGERWDGDE